MSRVEEIERAIAELSTEEFRQVAQRVHAIEEARWDKQLDGDAAAGRLDFLRQEAQEMAKNPSGRDYTVPVPLIRSKRPGKRALPNAEIEDLLA
jgi:hypothetical protein